MRDSSCSDSVGEILVFFLSRPWKVVANDRTGATWRLDSSTVYHVSLMKLCTRFCNCMLL